MGIRKKIRLGDKVKHSYTDFSGTVVAKTEYLNGCIQMQVVPKELNNGEIVVDTWLDEVELELILPVKTKKKKKGVPPNGGIRSHPKRR